MSVPLKLSVEASSADGRKELGQRAPQRRRIRMLVEDFAARIVQAHERAADGRTLEVKARDVVGKARRVATVRTAARRERASVFIV